MAYSCLARGPWSRHLFIRCSDSAACASSASRPSITTARLPGRRRPNPRRRPGRAVHAQEARCAVSLRMPCGYCLDAGRHRPREVDHVAFYEKPFLKFERLLETYLTFAPRGFPSFRHGHAALAEGKAVPEAAPRQGIEGARTGFRLGIAPAVLRASPEPCRQRLLSLAVRRSGCAHHGRRRRVGDDVRGPRRAARTSTILQGNSFSPLARAALFGLHLLHRLQGQFRGIQGDGPGALWRAEIRLRDPRAPDRSQG